MPEGALTLHVIHIATVWAGYC